MEAQNDYFARFNASAKMKDLFPDAVQRRDMAYQCFAEKWDEALVRVTRLDGTQFFID